MREAAENTAAIEKSGEFPEKVLIFFGENTVPTPDKGDIV